MLIQMMFLQIDIDEVLMGEYKTRTRPQLCDYVGVRTQPLVIKGFQGSVDQSSDCLIGTDAILGIEL